MFEVRWILDGMHHVKHCRDIAEARFTCTVLEGAKVAEVEVWQCIETRRGDLVDRAGMAGFEVVE